MEDFDLPIGSPLAEKEQNEKINALEDNPPGRFGIEDVTTPTGINRKVDLNGGGLVLYNGIDDSTNEWFSIKPGTGDGNIILDAPNTADDGYSQIHITNTDDVAAHVTLRIVNSITGVETSFEVRDGYVRYDSPPDGPVTDSILVWNATTKVIRKIPSLKTTDDFANDAAAATGGIAVGQLYHSSGAVKIRLV